MTVVRFVLFLEEVGNFDKRECFLVVEVKRNKKHLDIIKIISYIKDMNIRISDHAKQHMASCSITEQEVRDLFDEKIPVVKAYQPKEYEDCIEILAEISGKYCKIVYSYITNTVTTAFKLRKNQWLKLTK